MGQHHRVVVDVDHPARRVDRLGEVAAGACARQPGADVDELPHARLEGQEAHGALLEGKDAGHDRRDGRRGREHGPGRPAVGFKAVPAAIQEIRHARRVGHRDIDQGGFRPPGRVKLPVVSHLIPPPADSQRRCLDVNSNGQKFSRPVARAPKNSAESGAPN